MATAWNPLDIQSFGVKPAFGMMGREEAFERLEKPPFFPSTNARALGSCTEPSTLPYHGTDTYYCKFTNYASGQGNFASLLTLPQTRSEHKNRTPAQPSVCEPIVTLLDVYLLPDWIFFPACLSFPDCSTVLRVSQSLPSHPSVTPPAPQVGNLVCSVLVYTRWLADATLRTGLRKVSKYQSTHPTSSPKL